MVSYSKYISVLFLICLSSLLGANAIQGNAEQWLDNYLSNQTTCFWLFNPTDSAQLPKLFSMIKISSTIQIDEKDYQIFMHNQDAFFLTNDSYLFDGSNNLSSDSFYALDEDLSRQHYQENNEYNTLFSKAGTSFIFIPMNLVINIFLYRTRDNNDYERCYHNVCKAVTKIVLARHQNPQARIF